jgi:hypothetical protein
LLSEFNKKHQITLRRIKIKIHLKPIASLAIVLVSLSSIPQRVYGMELTLEQEISSQYQQITCTEKILPGLEAGLHLYEWLAMEGDSINASPNTPTTINTLATVEKRAEDYKKALEERLDITEWSELYKDKIQGIILELEYSKPAIRVNDIATPEQRRAYDADKLDGYYYSAAINMKNIAQNVAPFILEDVREFLGAIPNPPSDTVVGINALKERYEFNIDAEQNYISEEQNSIYTAFNTYRPNKMFPSAPRTAKQLRNEERQRK